MWDRKYRVDAVSIDHWIGQRHTIIMRSKSISTASLGNTIVGLCTLALNGGIHFNFDENKKPVAAVEFLKSEPLDGKMFNDDEFGDYIIYAAWPQYKVFFAPLCTGNNG